MQQQPARRDRRHRLGEAAVDRLELLARGGREAGGVALAEAIGRGQVPKLQKLGLEKNGLGAAGGEAIGSGKLENATLELDEFRELVIGLRGGMKLM